MRETEGTDGKYIQYLNNDKKRNRFRECFPGYSEIIFDQLESILFKGINDKSVLNDKALLKAIKNNRIIHNIEHSKLFHRGTLFFSKHININSGDRAGWNALALDKLKEADLIFFDPDNGINDNDRSGKSINHEDIVNFYKKGKSILIYQHSTRTKPFDRLIHEKIRYLKKNLDNNLNAKVTRYHRGTARAYLLLLNGRKANKIERLFDEFIRNFESKSKKMKHFTRVL